MVDVVIRDIREFEDKTQVRHESKLNRSTRYGVIDREKNVILSEGKEYSLNQFAITHLQKFNPTREAVDAWVECEVKLGGFWVSMKSIRKH